MLRTSPPFRAEHIGSLKRPLDLMQKRTEYASGSCSLQDLREAEDRAIKQAIAVQKSAGMNTITDGEYRRALYFEGIFDQLEGMEVREDTPAECFTSYLPAYEALVAIGTGYICKGKLRRTKCLYERDFLGLKKLVAPDDIKHIKLTMCCPELCHLQHGNYTYEKGVYSNDEEYFADVAKVYRDEINDLYALGCRNIQIDESYLAFFCDESMIRGMQAVGIDPDLRLDRYIRLLNDCIQSRPSDMTAGVHLCRGNTKDGFAKGGYGRIAAKLFQTVQANCFYLEYDTIRAGGFEPLKLLPPNKSVVLGLVSTRTRELEDPEKLKQQIYQAAYQIAEGREAQGLICSEEDALNQICISPQCGFSSISIGTHNTSEEDTRKKLSLVVKVAEGVWNKFD